MLKEMILQNYNHPSVVLWGAMNELWDYHKQAIALARELGGFEKRAGSLSSFLCRLSCLLLGRNPIHSLVRRCLVFRMVNGVNVYESWYQGDSATIAPMFDKFCSYSTDKTSFFVGIWSRKR